MLKTFEVTITIQPNALRIESVTVKLQAFNEAEALRTAEKAVWQTAMLATQFSVKEV
jgi:hypothetical protein